MNRRAYVAVAAVVGLFLLVQFGALALVEPFEAAGYQTVEDPQDPTNSLVYVGAILVATVLMLAAIRLDVDQLIRLLVIGSSGAISFYVFSVVVPPVVTVGAWNVLAVAAAALVAGALLVYPEWYVIDAAGVVMGAGAAGLFGISFGLLPALVLLVVLAVYDAISVYGTEHMLTLASGVMDLRLPIVLVVPLTLSYSFLDTDLPDAAGSEDGDGDGDADTDAGDESEGGGSPGPADPATTANGGEPTPEDGGGNGGESEGGGPFERDAFFIGLGDAVMPTVLVASAAFFAPASVPTLGVLGLALTLPVATAMAGTLAGLLVLMWLVMKGRPHAGLPLLNGGAIGGYLVGAVAAGVPLARAVGLAPYL